MMNIFRYYHVSYYRNESIDLNLEDFGVKPEFGKVIPKARKELLRIEDSTTPAAKLSCLQKCMDLLSGKGGVGNELNFTVTSEDLLPSLIYIIAKTSLNNWYTQLHYITDLRLSWMYSRYIQTIKLKFEYLYLIFPIFIPCHD